MELRDYQIAAIDAASEALRTSKTALIVAPTGSGKAIIIAAIAARAIKRRPNVRLLCLCTTQEILKQNEEKLNILAPDVETGIYCAGAGRKDRHAQVVFASRDSLGRDPLACGVFDGILVDEAHQVAVDIENSETMYAKIINAQNPKFIVGLTGTPWRLAGGRIWGDGKFFETIAYNIPMRTLIERGYLSEYSFPKCETQIDTSNVKTTSTGDFHIGQLEHVTGKQVCLDAIAEWKKHAENRRVSLFFCVSRAHGKLLTGLLCDEIGSENVCYIDGETRDRATLGDEIRAGKYRVIVNIGTLTTGFDAPIIDCVVFLRPTQSVSLFIQCLDLKTEILTKNGWKTYENISTNDVCLSFDLIDSCIKESKIINIIKRKLNAEEKWIGISSKRSDFKVTDGHRMILKTKNSWKFEMAKYCAELRFGFEYPVSGFSQNKDCALSDDEIRFIGWVISDGTITKNNVTISQSKPNYVDEINKLLKNLGFRFGHYIVNGKSQFKRNFDLHRFTISYANPRKISERHLSGCGYLKKRLSKSLPFEDFSDRQFDILMESIIKADGSILNNAKDGRGQLYIQSSFRICKSVSFIEKLQTLCVTHGWRADVHEYRNGSQNVSKENATCAVMSVSKCQTKFVGGKSQTDRAFVSELQRNEHDETWCVENELGTLITRRNGRVTIMGNCAGRGLRRFPGKSDCLFLDMGGNFERFRSIETPQVNCTNVRENAELSENPGQLPAVTKSCPVCAHEISIRATFCPYCGEVFVKARSKPFTGAQTSARWMYVKDIFCEDYLSAKGNDCKKITYVLNQDRSFYTTSFFEFFVKKNSQSMNEFRERMKTISKKPRALLVQIDGKLIKIIDAHY